MRKKIRNSGLAWIWVTVIVLTIDRLSKYWVMHHLSFYEPVAILPILNLTLANNTGAAFSFLAGASGWQNLFLGSLASVMSVIILCWLYKISSKERWLSLSLTLILAGALGNVWDRGLYGFVVDFIALHFHDWHFAIFNIADSAICIGVFLLFLYWGFRKNSSPSPV